MSTAAAPPAATTTTTATTSTTSTSSSSGGTGTGRAREPAWGGAWDEDDDPAVATEKLRAFREELLAKDPRTTKTLQKDEQKLPEIPPEISRLTNLEDLSISSNNLVALPKELSCLTRLRDFWACANYIEDIPEQISVLTRLQEINLGGNKLTAIPSCISCLTRLEKLWLWNNSITEIPNHLSCLVRLETLEIYGNSLTRISSGISSLTALEELILNDNKLTKLPEEISGLTKLKHLSLYGNALQSLPNSISRLTSLRQLQLFKNRLRVLPMMSTLTRLRELNPESTGDGLSIWENPLPKEILQCNILSDLWRLIAALPATEEVGVTPVIAPSDAEWQLRDLTQILENSKRELESTKRELEQGRRICSDQAREINRLDTSNNRLSSENKSLQTALETSVSVCTKCVSIMKDIHDSALQTGIFISKPVPAPPSLLNFVWAGKHNSPEYVPVAEKPGGVSPGAIYEKKPTCLKPHQGKRWLGKVSNRPRYTVYEKISSDMLQFFGVCGPKARLATLPVLNPFTMNHEWAKEIAKTEPKATFFMSKWIDGYTDIGQPFIDAIITTGSTPTDIAISSDGSTKSLPLRGFMRAAAVTKFVADTDFLGGSGKNAGYVIRNENGKQYAQFVKIDTGEAFSFRDTTNIESAKNLRHSQDICIANGATRNILFTQLNAEQKTEFLQTMAQIITAPASVFELLVHREEKFKPAFLDSEVITLTDMLKERQRLMITLYGQDIAKYLEALQLAATLHTQDTIQKTEASQNLQETIDSVRAVLEKAIASATTSTDSQPPVAPSPTIPPKVATPPTTSSASSSSSAAAPPKRN
ncbi:leucine-rich repeat protein [Pelomyxa schiedti]|nr:leucine-rich repeat protein [Pelomyxa schiedti]